MTSGGATKDAEFVLQAECVQVFTIQTLCCQHIIRAPLLSYLETHLGVVSVAAPIIHRGYTAMCFGKAGLNRSTKVGCEGRQAAASGPVAGEKSQPEGTSDLCGLVGYFRTMGFLGNGKAQFYYLFLAGTIESGAGACAQAIVAGRYQPGARGPYSGVLEYPVLRVEDDRVTP